MAGSASPGILAFLLGAVAFCGATGCSKADALKTLAAQVKEADSGRYDWAIRGFCPSELSGAGATLEEFYVRNLSAHIREDGIWSDYDRDGIPDLAETGENGARFELDPKKPDSNQDGYSDLAVQMAGITGRSQQNLRYRTCRDLKATSTVDRLTDCEKLIVLGLDPTQADNAGTGIPDFLKLIAGMNPRDPSFRYTTLSNDGLSQLQKAKLGLPIDSALTEFLRSATPELTSTKETKSSACAAPLKLTAANLPSAPTANRNLLLLVLVTRKASGERDLALCCRLADPAIRRRVELESVWSSRGAKSLGELACPCPPPEEIP